MQAAFENISSDSKLKDKYFSFATAIKSILEASLNSSSIHTIQARAKDFDSFSKKSAKIDENTKLLKYNEPLKEITDLAGVRVIAYVQQTLKHIEEIIYREFSVVERSDKDENLLKLRQIGYKSIHFLVKIKKTKKQFFRILTIP